MTVDIGVRALVDGERKMAPKKTEHSFSVEMDSRDSLHNVSLSDKKVEGVLVQGDLGKLVDLVLIEDVSLEVRGTKGTLRLDLTRDEIDRLLKVKADQAMASSATSNSS